MFAAHVHDSSVVFAHHRGVGDESSEDLRALEPLGGAFVGPQVGQRLGVWGKAGEVRGPRRALAERALVHDGEDEASLVEVGEDGGGEDGGDRARSRGEAPRFRDPAQDVAGRDGRGGEDGVVAVGRADGGDVAKLEGGVDLDAAIGAPSRERRERRVRGGGGGRVGGGRRLGALGRRAGRAGGGALLGRHVSRVRGCRGRKRTTRDYGRWIRARRGVDSGERPVRDVATREP